MALKTFSILSPGNSFFRTLLILTFFVLAVGFVPAVGSVLIIFLPMLTFFYGTVTGNTKTAAAFLIPVLFTFLVSYFLHLKAPYPAIFIMGTVGLAISAVIPKNRSIEKILIYPTLIIIGAICAFFIYSGYQFSVNPWKVVQKFVETAIGQNINFYAQLPLNKEEIDLVNNNRQLIIGVFTNIFPALAIIGSVVVVWINVLLGRNSLRKTGLILPQLNELSRWKAPEFLIWIFIATGGLLLFSHEQIRLISMNVFLLACFLYLLQGLAIVSFLFQNKNVPVFLRYLFYFLIVLQQFLMIPIALVGLFDIWVDFRKFIRNNQIVT
ncbi:MAG: DUF2232 domain-containing protein [Smithella sp.]|nr:DUF2232 domain-containing protein [Syntrophaceae bacterium]NTW76699.1 DUF2232 domain-containing protein [Syntrophaceae bacterium]